MGKYNAAYFAEKLTSMAQQKEKKQKKKIKCRQLMDKYAS